MRAGWAWSMGADATGTARAGCVVRRRRRWFWRWWRPCAGCGGRPCPPSCWRRKTPVPRRRRPSGAIWYTYVTVTTVGYGDRYPVTNPGRVVGVLIMTVGVGLFGTLTGFLASAFVTPAKDDFALSGAGVGAPDEVRAELAEIRQQLRELQESAAPGGACTARRCARCPRRPGAVAPAGGDWQVQRADGRAVRCPLPRATQGGPRRRRWSPTGWRRPAGGAQLGQIGASITSASSATSSAAPVTTVYISRAWSCSRPWNFRRRTARVSGKATALAAMSTDRVTTNRGTPATVDLLPAPPGAAGGGK